jgi:hypothetical protein
MAMVGLLGVLTGAVGPAAWSAAVTETLLAAGFSHGYASIPAGERW